MTYQKYLPSEQEMLPTEEKIITLEQDIEELGYVLPQLTNWKYSFLKWGVWLLIAAVVLFGWLATTFPLLDYIGIYDWSSMGDLVDFYEFLILMILGILLYVFSYYNTYTIPRRNVLDSIHEREKQLYFLKRDDTEEWKNLLQKQVQDLGAEIDFFFQDLSRKNRVTRLRNTVQDILTENPSPPGLSRAESYINTAKDMIRQEKREQREQRTWQYLAIAIMIVYILVLAGIVIWYSTVDVREIPVFGIPISIVIWGATGSLSAILYRFYKEQNRVQLGNEIRWLIARPMIGIIMSGVVYLALFFGLDFLGSAPDPATLDLTAVKDMGAYWFIAFMAGFSDKFYEGIIDIFLSRYTDGEEEPASSSSSSGDSSPESESSV